MNARTRFEATRSYVIELREVQSLIMNGCDDWKPEQVGGGGISDPTAAAAIEQLTDTAERLEELKKRESELTYRIGETLVIIERVREGLGDEYASLLEQRYIDCLSWRDVEYGGKRVARSTGSMRVQVAFDWIDSLGVSRVLNGEYEL